MALIYTVHSQHFDLVREEDLAGRDSLGLYAVATRDGEEQRHKILVDDDGEGYTVTQTLEGWVPTPVELSYFVQGLTDRHAESGSIIGVAGDDEQLVNRVAALLGAPVLPDWTPPVNEAGVPVADAAAQ